MRCLARACGLQGNGFQQPGKLHQRAWRRSRGASRERPLHQAALCRLAAFARLALADQPCSDEIITEISSPVLHTLMLKPVQRSCCLSFISQL